MNVYQELGLDTMINASDTYTRIGGSRMSPRTLQAMEQAAASFVDLDELSGAICRKIAQRTGNEAAFISSGAGACVVLLASACMAKGDAALEYALPDASRCPQNEIIVFASQRDCPILPYWHLTELSGARLIPVADDLQALNDAFTERTAAVFFFAGTVYEWTTPALPQVIEIAHQHNVPIIVDAAAQLPPKSLMWHYTCELGADAVIFSGGKFMCGPQTTGLALGRAEILNRCKALASPNVRIGRPYKVGKEEYAGLYRACMDFLDLDEKQRYQELLDLLTHIRDALTPSTRYHSWIEEHGRLGQAIPMLYLQFDDGTTGQQAYDYLYNGPDRIDIGKFSPGDPTGDPHRIFVNAINLRPEDVPVLIQKLNRLIGSAS